MKCFGNIMGTEGQEVAEAALVLPIVFLVLVGIFWFGRAFNISGTLERAAKEGALAASQATCATCGNTFSSGTSVADAVQSVLSASSINVSSLQAYAPPFVCTPAVAPACTTTVTSSGGQTFNLQICSGAPLSCGTGAAAGCGTASPPACGTSPVYGTRIAIAYRFDFLRLTYSSGNLGRAPSVTLPAVAQTVPEN
jgi:Flp pilus assembly protein TadG